MKHKHYDMIVAWAEGKKIQLMTGRGWEDWIGKFSPRWDVDLEYQIKPRTQWQQDLIDAAKAGKVVEFNDNGWYQSNLNTDLEKYNFSSAKHDQYRIRPTKVTRYLWAEKAYARWLEGSCFMSDVEAVAYFKPIKCEYLRLDYTATEFGE